MTSEEFKDKVLNFTDEWVFHTVQGEGKFVGVPSVFIRLAGCNLRCQWSNGDGTITTCDTPHSSHHPEKNIKTIKETIGEVLKHNCKHVVITGGEPHLQENVVLLINGLVDMGKLVTVESNGTIYRDHKAQMLSISPKLATSCVHTSEDFERHHTARMNVKALADFVKRPHQLKFVIQRESDITDIKALIELVKEYNGSYDEDNIYLMPQGITQEQFDKKLPWIIEIAKQLNWKVTDRFHIRAFGSKRGV